MIEQKEDIVNTDITEIFDKALTNNQDDIIIVSDLLSQNNEIEDKIVKEIENDFDELSANPDNTLSLYMKQVALHPLLTKEKELELGKKYLESKDMNARNMLVESNLRLVIKNALKFKGRGIDILDLIQEGNLGLIKAADKFDYKKGYRFTTYATWWVMQGIRQLTSQGKSNVIYVPVYIQRKQRTVNGFLESFKETHKRAPTITEIADETGFSPRTIKTILETPSCSLTLDASINDGSDEKFSDFASDEDELSTETTIEKEFVQSSINDCIEKILDNREKYIVKLYYGFGGNEKCSLQDIGDRLHITRERVRQIKKDALKKLNEQADINLDNLR